MRKKIIFVVGKTSSGKDTVAKYLREKYGISEVISYATRPIRDYETEGVEHYFVNADEMDYIMQHDSVLAYTKFKNTGYEYCATVESITGDCAVYVIDPKGIDWYKENYRGEKIDTVSIFVDLDEGSIIERAKSRGDSLSDIIRRLDSERDMMDNFSCRYFYDYLVDNRGTPKDLMRQVDEIMSKIL